MGKRARTGRMIQCDIDPSSSDFRTKLRSLIESDDVVAIERILEQEERGAECFIPDDLFLLLWNRVIRGESKLDPIQLIKAEIEEVDRQAFEKLLVDPDRRIALTRPLVKAMFPDSYSRRRFASIIVRNRVRQDVLDLVFDNPDLLKNCHGRYCHWVLAGLRRNPDILDRPGVLEGILKAENMTPDVFLGSLSLAMTMVMDADPDGLSDQFAFLDIFRRIIVKLPPQPDFYFLSSQLFSVAVTHVAIAYNWGLAISDIEFLTRSDDDLIMGHHPDIVTPPEVKLARESLRIILGLPRRYDRFDTGGITMTSDERGQFIQECLVRVCGDIAQDPVKS